MTNQQITNAYIALSRMGNMQMPLPVAYQLFQLRQTFKTQFDFVAEQERVIVERHDGVKTENGDYKFANKGIAMAVYNEMRELHDMEVEVQYNKVSVELSPTISGTLSMNDLEALDGIVVFK